MDAHTHPPHSPHADHVPHVLPLGTYLKTVETVDIDRRLRELESKSAVQK